MQGQVENNNKWMETYIRMFFSHQQDNWANLLPMVEFAYNNHHHPSIDTMPFFANFRYHPTLMNILTATQSSTPDKWIQWIHNVQAECKHVIERSQAILKRNYDQWRHDNPGFEIGDTVWLEATNLSTNEPSLKLASEHHGPFQIREKLLDLMYQLELPPLWKIHDVFHVSVLSEVKPDTILDCRNLAPPPIKVNDEDFWVMEKYIDACWFCNHFQFKIRWEGFTREHDTWENMEDIDSDDGSCLLDAGDDDFNLEEDFYWRHPDAPRKTDPPEACTQTARCCQTCK
jgi:hypothetical protein